MNCRLVLYWDAYGCAPLFCRPDGRPDCQNGILRNAVGVMPVRCLNRRIKLEELSNPHCADTSSTLALVVISRRLARWIRRLVKYRCGVMPICLLNRRLK